MGLLVEGKWQTDWYDTKSTEGRFVRKAPSFRNWITSDGSAGPSGMVDSKRNPGATTCMFPWRVRGRTAR